MKKPKPENKKRKFRGKREQKGQGGEKRRRGKEREPAGCTADIARLPAGQIGNKNISIVNKKLR